MQILRNGKMLFSMPGATALAVDHGCILAAGSEEDILNFVPPRPLKLISTD
jgi:predicted amidohydrolase YtcJ